LSFGVEKVFYARYAVEVQPMAIHGGDVVIQYAARGAFRLMTKRQYSDNEKAAALAALLTGQSLDAVAEEYRIPRSTLDSWRNPRRPQTFETKKDSGIGDLLMEYLQANLAALKVQAEVFADKGWLKEQGAQEAGVLHGIMTDKAVRLLEAFGAHDSNPAAAD
jgi:transposase-like protein